jgi:hypothetical protein
MASFWVIEDFTYLAVAGDSLNHDFLRVTGNWVSNLRP